MKLAETLRLAAQLTAALGRQLIALDEPTLGLHPSEQPGMRDVHFAFTAQGGDFGVIHQPIAVPPHLQGEVIDVQAPLPDDLAAVLASLGMRG